MLTSFVFLFSTVCAFVNIGVCIDIVTVEKDFSNVKTNQDLAKHVQEILHRLKTFKVAVHPRIRLFYELLKLGMTNYAHKTSESLYKPDKFNLRNDNRL